MIVDKIKSLKNIQISNISKNLSPQEISDLELSYQSSIQEICFLIRNENGLLRLYCDCGNRINLNQLKKAKLRNKIPYCCISCASKSTEAKEKLKNTMQKLYRVSSAMQSKELREKHKKTMLEKYGVEYALQSTKLREKCVNTCLSNYGVRSPTQQNIIKNKIKKTCLERYGFDHNWKVPEIREKIKQTNLERFGFENPMKNLKIRDKVKTTINLKYSKKDLSSKQKERFDYINYNFLDIITQSYTHISKDIRWKLFNKTGYATMHSFRTFLKQNNITYDLMDNQQTYEYQIIDFISKRTNKKIIHGYRLNGLELDIYVPELNLAIEVNGDYWHSVENKNQSYHLNKTNLCESKGIRLLHIWEHEWINDRKYVEYILNCYLNNKIPNYKCYTKLNRDYFSTLDFLNPKIEEPILEKSGKFDVYKTGYIIL